MLSTVGQENRQKYLSGCGGNNQFQTTSGRSNSLTNDRGKEADCPRPSVLGGVRRITRKRGAGGRDIVEIEHTDGTETILVFDAIA